MTISILINVNIDVHCEWTEWEIVLDKKSGKKCSKPCGGGKLTKKRKERVTAKYGGKKCTGPTVITESCNVKECPGKVSF